MFLAWKEIRRAKVRFGLLIAAVALLVFLILFQQSLQNGLLTSFVGAIRNQSAPVLVYSTEGRRILQASVITPDLEDQVRAQIDDADIARIAQGTFTVTPSGFGSESGSGSGEAAPAPVETSIIGYERDDLGGPTDLVKGRKATAAHEAVASDADAADGFDVGDTVRVEPGGLRLTVVGLAPNAQLNVSPTLFVGYDTYLDAVAARNPDAGTPLPNALAARPTGDESPAALTVRINALSTDLDALTRTQAADESPGVAQVRQSFQIIFALFGFVVPLVTGLFFLIITFQKASSLTLLRAIGAPASRLITSLLVQVLVVLVGALAVGIGLYSLVVQVRVGGIPLRFETFAVAVWTLVLVVGGVVSALFSARRVLAIDPINATTSAGVGR